MAYEGMNYVPDESGYENWGTVGIGSGGLDAYSGSGGVLDWLGGLNTRLQKSGILGSVNTQTGMKTDGLGSLALSGIGTLGNLFMGMQQYGLAKQQLNFQKQAFNTNFGAQQKTVNSQLEDRQRARIASNSNAYESLDSYLAKNRV